MPTSAPVSKQALLERVGQEVSDAKAALERLKGNYVIDVERAQLYFQSCLKRYAQLKEELASEK